MSGCLACHAEHDDAALQCPRCRSGLRQDATDARTLPETATAQRNAAQGVPVREYELRKLTYTEAMLERQEYGNTHRRESLDEASQYDMLCAVEEAAEDALDRIVLPLLSAHVPQAILTPQEIAALRWHVGRFSVDDYAAPDQQEARALHDLARGALERSELSQPAASEWRCPCGNPACDGVHGVCDTRQPAPTATAQQETQYHSGEGCCADPKCGNDCHHGSAEPIDPPAARAALAATESDAR